MLIIVALIVSLLSFSELIADDQLTTDIEMIASAVDERYRNYVIDYLREGAPATGATFVPAAVAKNELNRVSRDERFLLPLARCMTRFASSADFAEDTRRYAFAKVTQLSKRNTILAADTKRLANQLIERDDKLLGRAAREFLDQLTKMESRKELLSPERIRFDPETPEPSLPDPREQSDADRLNTLRTSMEQAIELLEQQKDLEFFNRFIDPFWIARYSADAGVSEDEILAGFLTSPEKGVEIRQQFLSTLRRTVEKSPKWLLGGRVASFIEGRKGSHSAEFWIYIDGGWKISPET